MTDTERAESYVMRRWLETKVTPRMADELADLLAQFAAVRLDERRAIAAWLRALYQTRRGDPTELADLIERGEHGS